MVRGIICNFRFTRCIYVIFGCINFFVAYVVQLGFFSYGPFLRLFVLNGPTRNPNTIRSNRPSPSPMNSPATAGYSSSPMSTSRPKISTASELEFPRLLPSGSVSSANCLMIFPNEVSSYPPKACLLFTGIILLPSTKLIFSATTTLSFV